MLRGILLLGLSIMMRRRGIRRWDGVSAIELTMSGHASSTAAAVGSICSADIRRIMRRLVLMHCLFPAGDDSDDDHGEARQGRDEAHGDERLEHVAHADAVGVAPVRGRA